MAKQRRETVLQRRMRMIECKRDWARRKREGLPTRGVFAAWPDLPEDLSPPVRRAATRRRANRAASQTGRAAS